MLEKIPYNKPVLSLDEKINLLISRGLRIPDRYKAKKLISHIGYFRLTGYLKYFQDKETDKFYEGTTIEKVINLYVFDRELRLLSLHAIESIEVSLKANINDYMSEKYGCFWYSKESSFFINDRNRKKFDKLSDRISDLKHNSSSIFITTFYRKYTQDTFPSWMLFEELSIGELTTIFKIFLKNNDKKNISQRYGVNEFKDFENWIHLMRTIRNISAHHSRLWNKEYTIKLSINDKILKEKLQVREMKNRQEVIPNFYNTSLVIQYLLNKIGVSMIFHQELESLFCNFPNIDITKMGFKNNWNENFE